MPLAKKAKSNLLERIRAVKPRTMIGQFTPEQVKQIDAAIDEIHSGKSHASLAQLRSFIADEFGVSINKSTFVDYATKRRVSDAKKPS